MDIIGIMACDPQGIIGNNNTIPWRFEDDVKHFQSMTDRSLMIMGYNTYLSLPKSLFATRIGIVLTQQHFTNHDNFKDIFFVNSLNQCIVLIKEISLGKNVFMIGGAQIAKLFIQNNIITKFFLTKLEKPYQGNCYLDLRLFDSFAESIIKKTNEYTIYCYTKIWHS